MASIIILKWYNILQKTYINELLASIDIFNLLTPAQRCLDPKVKIVAILHDISFVIMYFVYLILSFKQFSLYFIRLAVHRQKHDDFICTSSNNLQGFWFSSMLCCYFDGPAECSFFTFTYKFQLSFMMTCLLVKGIQHACVRQ